MCWFSIFAQLSGQFDGAVDTVAWIRSGFANLLFNVNWVQLFYTQVRVELQHFLVAGRSSILADCLKNYRFGSVAMSENSIKGRFIVRKMLQNLLKFVKNSKTCIY